MSWYVYMVQCRDGSLYTGVTTELKRRVEEHNVHTTLGAKYTKARRPVVLVYQKGCSSRSEAQIQEADIRRLSRAKKLALIDKTQ